MIQKNTFIRKNIFLLLIFLLPSLSLGQGFLFKESTFLISNLSNKEILKDTAKFKPSPDSIFLPQQKILWVRFKLPQNLDSNLFVFSLKQDLLKLYRVENNIPKLIGQTGFVCPLHLRSKRDDRSVIKLINSKNSANDYLLEINNYSIKNNQVKVFLYDYEHYEEIYLKAKNSVAERYGVPIFLGIILLIVIFSVIQFTVFREKIYFLYLLYIVFVLIRVSMGVGLLIFEDYIPFLRQVGFMSSFSQIFSQLSFIVYLLFLREYMSTRVQMPKFDIFIKAQIIFLSLWIVFDACFTVEKYINPSLNTVFRLLEIFRTLVSFITLIILFKFYNELNKYVIFGVSTLFVFAFLGQEIVFASSGLSRFQQESVLQVLWGVAYVGEIIFFTIGLINRGAILQKTVELQLAENQKLIAELSKNKQKPYENQFEALSIPTTKGTLLLQQTDIIRLEASGSYSVFYVQNQKQVVASYSLADFEQKLNPEKFIRVHKSHIVNLAYINKYLKGDGGSLVLNDLSEIPVSRTRKDELLKKLFTV